MIILMTGIPLRGTFFDLRAAGTFFDLRAAGTFFDLRAAGLRRCEGLFGNGIVACL
jgi:hypothetical protein